MKINMRLTFSQIDARGDGSSDLCGKRIIYSSNEKE